MLSTLDRTSAVLILNSTKREVLIIKDLQEKHLNWKVRLCPFLTLRIIGKTAPMKEKCTKEITLGSYYLK